MQVLGLINRVKATLDSFKGDQEKLNSVYELKTRYKGGDTMNSLRQKRSQDKSQKLVAILLKDLKSTWNGSDEDLRTLLNVSSLDHLVHAPMGPFTGFLVKHRRGRENFWTYRGKYNLHKITLEYLKTDIRQGGSESSLITMISDTIASDTTFEASKRTFKKARDKSKTDLISFIAVTMEGEPAGDTAVQSLKDDLINPSFRIATGHEKTPEPLSMKEVLPKRNHPNQGRFI